MKTLSFILASFLSLTGCAMPLQNRATIHWHGDTNFSKSERDCVEFAADKWEEQTSGQVHMEVDWDYRPRTKNIVDKVVDLTEDHIQRWESWMPEVKAYDTDDGLLLGLCSGDINAAVRKPVELSLVVDRLTNKNLCRITALHEMGHALGLSHIANVVDTPMGPQLLPSEFGNIMYPSANAANTACLKAQDLLEWCSVYDGCDSAKLKPCASVTVW